MDKYMKNRKRDIKKPAKTQCKKLKKFKKSQQVIDLPG